MEEENKISFWKKIKISIFGLEDYQKLAGQKIVKSIGYLAKLMLIFVFLVSIVLTYQISVVINNINQYLENEISEISFQENRLTVTSKENSQEPIIIEGTEKLNGKLIVDTQDLTEEQINKYEEEIKGYTNGVLILKDKIIFKTSMTAVSSTISFSDIANQYHIVKLDKQDILNMLSGSNVWIIYIAFFVSMAIYMFIIYFSNVLIEALLYSFLGYITGGLSRIRLRYSANYNIAVHSLTLPIILNLVYMIVNLLTGYTIKYFEIMYMAITCVYVITAILMIKSDIIKKQMELSKIISEQEKVRQEMERREQEKREEEERERIRKEDEKKRQEEKQREKEGSTEKDSSSGKNPRENDTPQPEANIQQNEDISNKVNPDINC